VKSGDFDEITCGYKTFKILVRKLLETVNDNRIIVGPARTAIVLKDNSSFEEKERRKIIIWSEILRIGVKKPWQAMYVYSLSSFLSYW
jgi:hypothetical protein